MKKNLKWLILALAVLVLAAGVVTGILLLGGEKTPAVELEPVEQQNKIYWNVERSLYGADESGLTTRNKTDGKYRARMAVDGEQLDVFFSSESQMIYADSLYFMGLEFDEEGNVSRVVPVEEFTGGTAYLDFYVESFTEDSVTSNMGLTFQGPRITYTITEDTKIYDVSDTGLLAGTPGVIEECAKVHGILAPDGTLSHLFVEKPFEPKPVYWNVERMYDKTSKLSTRTPDATGVYVITFAVDGQQVELKCKDFETVCAVDAFNTKCMSLVFDEEGYIIKAESTKVATGNSSAASWYHVMSLDETGFFAEKFSGSDMGKTATVTYAKDVKIYDVSGQGAYVGEPTQLRLYDQVHGLRNPSGQVCIVFVVNRFIDGQMYWSVERMWDSKTQQTTRVPDAQGYYHILMAVDGKQVTVRTKDRDIVNSIDSRAAKCCVLRLEGNEIVEFGTPAKYKHGISFASWCDVQSISGGVVKAKRILTGDNQGTVYEGELADDCKVYNVSESAAMIGEETTLQVGDRIHGLKGLDGKIHIIYVVARPFISPMYWNIHRTTYYSTKTKVSTRPQSEDGYWYFEMAVNEEVITVKTKDAELAQKMDSYIAMGLTLSADNTVLKAVKYNEVKGYSGGSFASWYDVTSLDGGKITCEKNGQTVSAPLATNCVIYDVSSSVNMGKKSTVNVGDRIQGFKDENNQVVLLYVVSRKLDVGLYWNRTRMYDSKTAETTRTPDADGYYTMEFAYEGSLVTLKCKDKSIVTKIDARAAMCCTLSVRDGEIFKMGSPSTAPNCEGGTFVSWADVTKIEGASIEVDKSGTKTTGTLASDCKIYDVTGAEPFGAVTTIQVGDLIHGQKNKEGLVTYLFVIERASSQNAAVGLYWNRTRKYDSINKVTTRTPDADGYYTMEFAHEGQVVTLRCQDKDVVTYIDSRAAMACALTVEEGMILSAAVSSGAPGCEGGTFVSWADVTKIEGTSIEVDKSGTKTTGTLASDCKIYDVTGAEPFGAVTTIQVGDLIHGQKNKEGLVTYLFVIERAENTPEPPVTTEHKHCVCGGLGSVGDHTTCADVTWEAWDGTTTLESGKYYYLTGDVTGWEGLTVEKGDTVTLCLNGKTITGASSVNRLINISGTLNLCDHKDGDAWAGSIISTKDASSMAPVFYVKEGGTFNFYGGNLTATKPAKEVGVGVVYKAAMNMYGGKIYGGTFGVVQSSTGKGGGNLGIFDQSVFTMYGGEISGGSSVQRGGNVYVNSSKGTFKMLGGLITGGTAANEGGGVFIREGGTVILGGSAKITGNAVSNLYMGGSMKLTITEDLTENAIGITLENTSGVFTEAVEAEALAWFVSDAGRVITQNADGELEIKEDMIPNIVAHCPCGAMTAEGQNVTHQEGCSQELLIWTAVDQAYITENGGKLMDSPGNYYLTENVEVTAQISFQDNSAYNFDLNGYTVDMNTLNRLVALMSADFNGISICFTNTAATEGSIVFGEKDMGTKQGSLVTIIDYYGTVTDCSVTFLGGIYDLSARTTNSHGGCINIDCADPDSTVNIYGGTYKSMDITGDKASRYGGLIRIPAGKTVNIKNATIYGGTLHGTKANYCGGAIAVMGTCVLENTTVTGGSADLGSGVYVAANASLTLGSDVKITGNTGSNLYLESGVTVKVQGTLAENAVGVTLASGTGVFTEVIVDEANITAFFSDAGLSVIKNSDNKLELEENT